MKHLDGPQALKVQHFGTSPVVRNLETSSDLSRYQTIEVIYAYIFAAKLLTHNEDTLTYRDTLKCTNKEKQLWYDAMVKELKSLRKLWSFKMVTRPRGSNIL